MIEVIWTLVPVLILVGDRDPVDPLLRHQYSPPPADVTVKVTGHQWYWTYEYPDNGVTLRQLHAEGSERPDAPGRTSARAPTPTDRRCSPSTSGWSFPQGKVVKFIVTADDVIHSFAVPAFWIKQDANPGQLHETWVKVDRPGVYFGQCSELCGARHGFMPIARRSRPAGAVRAVGRLEGRAHAGRQAAGARHAATAAAAGDMPTPAPAGAAGSRACTNQAATAQN